VKLFFVIFSVSFSSLLFILHMRKSKSNLAVFKSEILILVEDFFVKLRREHTAKMTFLLAVSIYMPLLTLDDVMLGIVIPEQYYCYKWT